MFRLTDEGRLRQIVLPHRPLDIPIHDLREMPLERREAVVLSRIEESAQQLFDLSEDFMLRATLLRLADEEHQLLVTMHHIASDGWSLGVMNLELSQLYRAYQRNDQPATAAAANAVRRVRADDRRPITRRSPPRLERVLATATGRSAAAA